MKKLVCLTLAVLMILSLCACGESGNKEETPKLRVGFGKADITPTESVLIAGGGDSNRFSENVLDPITVTVIAITDETDTTALLVTQDTLNSHGDHSKQTRDSISQATGVSYDNIFICATHTHAAPGLGSSVPTNAAWQSTVYASGVIRAAKQAMEDRSEATALSGATNAPGYVFVRRYYLDDGTVQGASGNKSTSTNIVSHIWDANDTIQMVRFVREDKKDILLTNLGVHCTFNGANHKLDISADYPAGLRTYVEAQDSDVQVAFFAAAAGEQVGNSDLLAEKHNLNYYAYGEKIGEFIVNAMPDLKPMETGLVKSAHQKVTVNSNSISSERLAAANTHWELFQKEGFSAAEAAAKADGFAGIYECMGVRMRAGLPPTQTVPISVLTVGDLSFSFSSYEMYGVSSADLVKRSPYENTFVITCANGAAGYFPTEQGFDLQTYEAYTSRVERGTAEKMVNGFLEMLTNLKGTEPAE